jgi:hypothetical protein
VINAVPAAVGVKVTGQLPEDRMQTEVLKDPATPVSVKLTTPVGVIAVPGDVSETVAVQVEAWSTSTGLEQTMVADVARGFELTVVEALVLPLWVESPPYVPVISALPVEIGVYVTEQLPDTRVQDVGLNEPAEPVSANVTVPVGVVTDPVEVSITVAVQVEASFTTPEGGEQLTLVEDVCCPTRTLTTIKCTNAPEVALIVTL